MKIIESILLPLLYFFYSVHKIYFKMYSSNIVYAIHNFEAENEDEVTFQYGEPIVILEKDDQYLDGWWQVKYD